MSVIREKQQFTLSFDLMDEDGELNLHLADRVLSTASVKVKLPVGLTEFWATPTGTATTPLYSAANATQRESLAFGETTCTWTATLSRTTSTNKGVVAITANGGTTTTTTTELTKGSVNVAIDSILNQPSADNKALSTSGTWHFQVELTNSDPDSAFSSEPISIHVAEKLE